MAIRVEHVNAWLPRSNETAFYVGRPNNHVPDGVIKLCELGNPYPITDKADRKVIIEMFKVMLNDAVIHNDKVKAALTVIQDAHKTNDVVLLCWCHPEPCHAEVIRDIILQIEGLDTAAIQIMEDEKKLETAIFQGALDDVVDDIVESEIEENMNQEECDV